jgi:hypothetical protein
MENEEIAEAIRRATDLSIGLEEPLRQVAFGVILERLLAGEALPTLSAPVGDSGLRHRVSPDVAINLNEFLAAAAPKSHVDRLVAIAYHSLHLGDESGVTIEEVLNGYAAARLGKPKNIHDVVAQCVRRGLLIQLSSKKDGAKAWIVTPTGENYVEGGFQTQRAK